MQPSSVFYAAGQSVTVNRGTRVGLVDGQAGTGIWWQVTSGAGILVVGAFVFAAFDVLRQTQY